MAKRGVKKLHAKDALEFFNQVMVEQPLLPFLIPLGLFAWFVERWVVPFSNWVPLVAAVWATIQLLLSPILDGEAVLYSFESTPEVRIGVAFGSGGSQAGPGHNSGVVARHAENCGKEVGMVVPFEDNTGELTVSLVLKEWQFADGSVAVSNSLSNGLRSSLDGSPKLQPRTGSTLRVKVVEGRALAVNSKSGKCDPYVKLQYGKALYRTKTLSRTAQPVWNDKFEFDEIAGGEYLKIKCYNLDTFSDDSIGSARVNLEGLLDGASRDVWVPLEKVDSGEIRLEIERIQNDQNDNLKRSSSKVEAGWIELVIIEARDLVAADLRGTSDPYVRVHYGNNKKRTKVIYKTLAPQWNQTFEFAETGEPLILHVKDHNAVLPTASIGNCTVEYSMLSPNEPADKWIPLQGVRSGEIHVKIVRRVMDTGKKTSLETDVSALGKRRKISAQVSQSIHDLCDIHHCLYVCVDEHPLKL
ncbi:hypothetical protein ACQ4PT_033790 [Festuca glaucescens]